MNGTFESFWRSKKANDQGGHPTPTHANGRSTPDPLSRGQRINDGIYIITNEYHHRFVFLEDPNDTTPLKGHFRRGNRNAQWHVRNYGNEQYSIENVEHNRYVDSGNLAVVKAHVESSSEERLWRIQVLPTGEYTIATTDTRNLWMLPSDIAETPVELFNVYTDRRCWWTFERQDPDLEVLDSEPYLAENSGVYSPNLNDPRVLVQGPPKSSRPRSRSLQTIVVPGPTTYRRSRSSSPARIIVEPDSRSRSRSRSPTRILMQERDRFGARPRSRSRSPVIIGGDSWRSRSRSPQQVIVAGPSGRPRSSQPIIIDGDGRRGRPGFMSRIFDRSGRSPPRVITTGSHRSRSSSPQRVLERRRSRTPPIIVAADRPRSQSPTRIVMEPGSSRRPRSRSPTRIFMQDVTDPYPGGQRAPDSRSSGRGMLGDNRGTPPGGAAARQSNPAPTPVATTPAPTANRPGPSPAGREEHRTPEGRVSVDHNSLSSSTANAATIPLARPPFQGATPVSSDMSISIPGGRPTSGKTALAQSPAIPGDTDPEVFESEPYLAKRFGVHVPNLSGQVRRLGKGTTFSGTFSTVYPGLYGDKKVIEVAIKVLRTTKQGDNIERKFRRELLIWSRLQHVNILPLYGYFEGDEGGHFPSLISKWAEHGSAAQYINRDLRWDQRTSLLYDVAKGLNYLHGFEPVIIHADLKPQNVVVNNDGVGQLCDFGLTRFMQDGLETGLTTTAAHTGTVRYLAYELVDYEDKPIPTAATDMYALGCLGLEFIYRILPHASLRTNHGKIIRAIGDGVPPAKRPANPEEVVPILWDLVEACWINTPEERPTATQVSDYLAVNLEELSESLEECSWEPEYTNR